MEVDNKLPLKRIEFSLSKFNEVAIPHHLDLLRQHRANILKFEQGGDGARVRSEQTRARRVAAQLRGLLRELEGLRAQVRPQDLPRFDAITKRARDDTLQAIVDYLETSPLSINRTPESCPAAAGSAASTDSVGLVVHHPRPGPAHDEQDHDEQSQLQLQLEEQEAALRSRAAVLRGWSDLQEDVHELHGAWAALQRAAAAQGADVTAAARSVTLAADNVQLGRQHLAAAERLKAGAYGLGGAVCGLALGGPVGLVVGAKAGAAAALGGSLLGYVGARLLGVRRQKQIVDSQQETTATGDVEKDKDKDQ